MKIMAIAFILFISTFSTSKASANCSLKINSANLTTWETKKLQKVFTQKGYAVTSEANAETSTDISLVVNQSRFGYEAQAQCGYTLNNISYQTNTAYLVGGDAASSVRSDCFKDLVKHIKKNVTTCITNH